MPNPVLVTLKREPMPETDTVPLGPIPASKEHSTVPPLIALIVPVP